MFTEIEEIDVFYRKHADHWKCENCGHVVPVGLPWEELGDICPTCNNKIWFADIENANDCSRLF